MRKSVFIILCVIFVFSCEKSEKLIAIKDENKYSCDVKYEGNTIYFYFKDPNGEISKKWMLIKKGESYFTKNDLPKEYEGWNEMEIVLSKKDTSYSYSFLGIDYIKRIIKLNGGGEYMSVFEMKGVANYRREVYYDTQFRIDSIFEKYGNEVFRYK